MEATIWNQVDGKNMKNELICLKFPLPLISNGENFFKIQ